MVVKNEAFIFPQRILQLRSRKGLNSDEAMHYF